MKENFVNEVLENIWKDRYQKNEETLHENLRRVAKYCSTNKKEENEFYDLMNNRLFFPAGRTMSNSGVGKKLTLNNCFVAPQIKDDLDDIFNKVSLGAKTHQKGGGIGYDFSQLRPKGSPTSNDAIASGAVSFMDVFNSQTATILQGNRRGANMGVMNVYNMDIIDFINAKSYDEGKLNHFNVSVMVDDNFINAVKNNENIFLHYPVYDENGKILEDKTKWKYSKEASAKEIWDLIIKKAYDNGEPGIFFYDNLNKDNNLYYIENIVCTNPCAEYLAGTLYGDNPLTKEPIDSSQYGGACNLGSLFLHNFVVNPFEKHSYVDWYSLKDSIYIAVRFLDNIIDINNFPDKIYENYQKSFRTIGLGITGLADMLVMLNMKYNSQEGIDFTNGLMDYISLCTYEASISLAKQKGSFPFLDREKFANSEFINKHCNMESNPYGNIEEWKQIKRDIITYGIRNSKMLSVAPTGTLSLTFGNNCSSGLEPIFSLLYDRKVKINGQSDDDIKIVKMMDYAYYKWLQIKDTNKCIVTEDCFVTAMNMSVDEHINMLANIAFHVDMSCSKTINVPTNYSFEDTKNIYMKCHDLGVKGCTIFRPNEIRQGILLTENNQSTQNNITSMPKGYKLDVNDDLVGYKKTIINGCGKFYLHSDFDDMTGEQLETYIDIGSEGGCERNLQFISRLISLSLRYGIPIEEIIDQAKSIRPCNSYVSRTNKKGDTSKGTSCPSAIGFALEELNKKIKERCFADFDITDNEINFTEVTKSELIDNTFKTQSLNKCPDCGEPLSFEGGCVICKSCGWTKCE